MGPFPQECLVYIGRQKLQKWNKWRAAWGWIVQRRTSKVGCREVSVSEAFLEKMEVLKDESDLDRPRQWRVWLQEGCGDGEEQGLDLRGEEAVSRAPLTPERVLASCWGLCFTSRALFSFSFCCAISLSVFLAEGSVGTGWLYSQNGLSQTTKCAVGSLWDPKEEALRTNPQSYLVTVWVWGNTLKPTEMTQRQ